MTPDELRALADEATPGPWNLTTETWAKEHNDFPCWLPDADARLANLAPDLARLCAELGEALREISEDAWDLSEAVDRAAPALAKLSELEPAT